MASLGKAYDPNEVEARWYRFWIERGYFKAESPSARPSFSIVLPPPNVTGSLHLGHALPATLQDILIRWKRMAGFNCLWLPGTDHAGIATQMVVERELKKTEKKSRHDLGREEFLKRVWQWKERYGKRIGEQHQILGASLDWSRERFTLDEGLSRAVREVFVRLHQEGLIYRAERLINWCPSCWTALSDLEVEHETTQGKLWKIRYPVEGTDQVLVVATTRPETMLGDTAVAVHPEDARYRHLIGRRAVLPLTGRTIPIIGDGELVDPSFGTGVVKVTPGHDFNDYQTGLRHKLKVISLFDQAARLNEQAGDYRGLDRFEARAEILEDLKQQGLFEGEEAHPVPLGKCHRCGTVLEPRLSPQWFVKIAPLAQPAIAAVEKGETRFVPEPWTQTYFQWMRNIHDWTISRQLWWGHQIPAYYCTSCSPKVGDDTDLPLGSATTRVGGVDFARATPIVGLQPPSSCPRCGGAKFEQDPDVLDTWFSSALLPFSALGWPEKTSDLVTFYPNSVMETGHDILFFWVARMMMMGLHFMKEVPFRVVYLHAMVRDEKGEKMSKVKGNVIDPLDLVKGANPADLPPALKNKFPQGMPAFGADALRFTLASLTQQGRDIKLSLDRLAGYKAFANKLWNAARFVMMNLGDWRPSERSVPFFGKTDGLSLTDRWILSRLNQTIQKTSEALEGFDFSTAASTLYQFIWHELCDWYIELCKPALNGDDPKAKDDARSVLVFSLERVLRLLHPFMPFITEELWQSLPIQRGTDSIMISAFPLPEVRLDDRSAESAIEPLIEAIEAIRNIRGELGLSPQVRITVSIQAEDLRLRSRFAERTADLKALAGIGELRIEPPGKKPPQAAAQVGKGFELYVPLAGLIDLDAERARLRKEIGRVEADLSALNRKLENPSFVARAPQEVVEKDRARIGELGARRAKLAENLARLDPERTMPEEKKPDDLLPSLVGGEHGTETPVLKVTSSKDEEGGVDLSEELKGDLEGVSVPQKVDPQIQGALKKLREGTKEGLSSSDHYDLGVAYMGMGLVDEAVREFNQAKSGDKRKPPRAMRPAKRKAKASSKRKAQPKARKAAPKAKPKSRKATSKAKPKARKAAASKTKPRGSRRPTRKGRRS